MTDAPIQTEPTLDDIERAGMAIADHVLRTPVRHYPVLSELLGAEVWVKHENFQLLGAFKVRGGINLVSQTTQEERERGFITASSGNHGQSIAYASRAFGAACTVVLPEGANPAKAGSIAALGANVIFHGDVFERSREHAEELAEREGLRFVHAANEPAL
ncbi:MAG: pyridoxal-phosphate dependent enzyme, partial [Dehalococcoidia bacterium]|nr:pyridoxal-phosphate dependent enzyme [Dehalococcoidia bacterium]